MPFHLTLGFHDKAQADRITGTSRDQADRESARVPQRVQQAGVRVEFAQALLGPGQMIGFFARRVGELLAQVSATRAQALCAVKRLGADLADVVHPH